MQEVEEIISLSQKLFSDCWQRVQASNVNVIRGHVLQVIGRVSTFLPVGLLEKESEKLFREFVIQLKRSSSEDSAPVVDGLLKLLEKILSCRSQYFEEVCKGVLVQLSEVYRSTVFSPHAPFDASAFQHKNRLLTVLQLLARFSPHNAVDFFVHRFQVFMFYMYSLQNFIKNFIKKFINKTSKTEQRHCRKGVFCVGLQFLVHAK